MGLGDDGHLHLVTDQAGQAYGVPTAADLGCARQPGSRLFAESALGRGAPGFGTPGFGISRSSFKITPDLRIRFVGYRGQIVPSAPPADPYRNDCDPSLAKLPAVGTLDPWAGNPAVGGRRPDRGHRGQGSPGPTASCSGSTSAPASAPTGS
jgi:hypothetical protein